MTFVKNEGQMPAWGKEFLSSPRWLCKWERKSAVMPPPRRIRDLPTPDNRIVCNVQWQSSNSSACQNLLFYVSDFLVETSRFVISIAAGHFSFEDIKFVIPLLMASVSQPLSSESGGSATGSSVRVQSGDSSSIA